MNRLTTAGSAVRVAAFPGAARPFSSWALLCLLMLALGAATLPARAEDASRDDGASAAAPVAAATRAAEPAPAVAPAAEADKAASSESAQSDAAFFAQNARRPGMVSLHGGAQALKLSAGTGDAAAGSRMVVVNLSRRGVHEAASGDAGAPLAVQNARYLTQNLPRPLFEAVQLMHVGDRWEVYTPATPKVTGQKGRPGRPAIGASVFTLELLSAK